MFYIYQLPVPRLTESDPAFAPIVERAARLICTTPEFDDLAREVGLEEKEAPPPQFWGAGEEPGGTSGTAVPVPPKPGARESLRSSPAPQNWGGGASSAPQNLGGGPTYGATAPAERAQLRAELDGMIAHLYGLTEDEFAHILRTFPLVAQPVKDAALAAYRTFGPSPDDAEIVSLIKRGESAELEFKSSARWDMRENKKNKEMEQVIVKTVAAFLNSSGGTLLIGVDDTGAPLGLRHDYQTLGEKQNADGYELFLTDLLLSAYGKDVSAFLRITFGQVGGHDICQVAVKPSPKAIWVEVKDDKGQKSEQLFIRTNNNSRSLTAREATEYAAHRWK